MTSALEKKLLEAEFHLVFRTVLLTGTKTQGLELSIANMSVLHSQDFQSTFYRSVYYCVEWGGKDWYGLHVERRGQLLEVGFLLTLCVSRDPAQATK